MAARAHALLAHAAFMIGAARLDQLPADEGAEVAFAGRSNAGKSSAINAITGRRALARASKTPGRTQQINFFGLDATRRLVDLPGYGFAQVPAARQKDWGRLVAGYLERRQSLVGVVLLVDIRRGLMPMDDQLLGWCEARERPVQIVLTKADKLSRSRAAAALASVQSALATSPAQARVQLFSAPKRHGVDALIECLARWLDLSSPQKTAPAGEPGG